MMVAPHADHSARTPLFEAQHAERYARHALIKEYEELTGANLIVMIDGIFHPSITLLEELLYCLDSSRPLHVMLSTPGGDGEVAVRLVRAMQARCSELTIVVPDMAKSAGTIMCLGANFILMAPFSDLGPVDPQFQLGEGGLAGAKEILAAVDRAEQQISQLPDTFPLYAGLLADLSMVMVEQARSAISRSSALVEEALLCAGRTGEDAASLASSLQSPLIEAPNNHSETIGPDKAASLGLPVLLADCGSREWQIIWQLWTRYFAMGAFPAAQVAIYEGRSASQVIGSGA